MKRIVVLGAGFAGLWSALGAARKLDELKIGPGEVEVTLVNRDAWHGIRVRNYEADLRGIRVPLDDILGPVGVKRVEGEVVGIDFARRQIACTVGGATRLLPYDRFVLALGSRVVRPDIPGLARYAFDVDTYGGASRLSDRMDALAAEEPWPGQYTVLVIGAGLTGIEVASEMPGRLRAAIAKSPRPAASPSPRVVLADRQPWIGSDMGESARPVIEEALAALGIETRAGITVSAIGERGATLSTGEVVPAATVVWCAGLRAAPLTSLFPVVHDRLGRIPVDAYMKVATMDGAFAAGDCACARIDGAHSSVMSCQHGRPMGRFAGHNAVCDLLGLPMLPLRIDWYTTILDLGPWGAVYTEGWDRQVAARGPAAKATKETINRKRIYPPLRDRRAILDAAAPVVQAPPPRLLR